MYTLSLYWKAAILVTTISFISSIAGFGVGSITTSIGSLFIDPKRAVGIGNMVFLGTTGSRATIFHPYIKWKIAKRVLLPAVGGVFFGAWALGHLPSHTVKRALGLFLILASLLRTFPKISHLSGITGDERWSFVIISLTSGFFSSFAHIGGPLIILILRGMDLDRREVVGTASIIFFSLNIIKFVNYLGWGIVNMDDIIFGVYLTIPAILGIVTGKWALERISEGGFDIVIYSLFILIGLRLLLLG